jgi:5-methylcytosine-specific restriction endonuclease McrA
VFTPAGKGEVKAENDGQNGGQTTCSNCGQATVPAKQSQSGVTPPGNETHVDHIVAKSKGGDGAPSNGQVLCRDCNLKKSDK